MTERDYLVKAQEADAVANLAVSSDDRRYWEAVAEECRRLARALASERRTSYFDGGPQQH
jgi:hypothetical protein